MRRFTGIQMLWIRQFVFAPLAALIFATTPAIAQSAAPTKSVEAKPSVDSEKVYGKQGISLTCAPSPNGVDYICYKKSDGKKPSALSRFGNWLFRLVRDPIAVFTAALLGIGLMQVSIAQRTAHRQLRAYMGVDFCSITDGSSLTPPEDVGTVRGVVVMKNSGQTPAHEVSTWAGIEIARQSEEDKLHAPKIWHLISVSSVFSGATTVHQRTMGRHLTDHEISEIKTGKSAIYIYGMTKYKDIFGKTHSTTFRQKYSGLWPPSGSPSMIFCENGNNAD